MYKFGLNDQYFLINFLSAEILLDFDISSSCNFIKGGKFPFKSMALIIFLIASFKLLSDLIFAIS